MLEKASGFIVKMSQDAKKIVKENKDVFIAVTVTTGAMLALFGVVNLFKGKNIKIKLVSCLCDNADCS